MFVIGTIQTVTVAASENSLVEGVQTLTIAHTSDVLTGTGSDYWGLTVDDVDVTVYDANTATVVVRPSDLSIVEGGPSIDYTLMITSRLPAGHNPAFRRPRRRG